MVNLRNRIQELKQSTGSLEVKELCETALLQLDELNKFNVSPSSKSEFERGIIENLIVNLKKYNDKETLKFLEREERFFKVNNLGVNLAIQKISESDLSGHPALKYTLEKFKKQKNLPEYMLAEDFLLAMRGFEWHPLVKESLRLITENLKRYQEDFLIHKAIYNLKNSKSAYILSAIQESIDEYLVNPNKVSKARLIEKLNKFIFDPFVRDLANAIRESQANSLDTNQSSRSVKISKIFSPVLLTETSEIFAIGQDFYEKKDNDIRRLNKEEIAKLDTNFLSVAKFLNSEIVNVTEEAINIFVGDKKISLLNENHEIIINLNGKKISRQDLNMIFTNTGIFRRNELIILEEINRLIDNFESIVEIDFAKHIESRLIENRSVDIIRLGDKIFLTQNDPHMGSRNFYKNLNATQTRKLVNEFLNYDISEAFTDMLSKEEAENREIENTKKAYIQIISQLEEKLADLNQIHDKDILESEEYKSIVKVLQEEIQNLKSEYNDYVAKLYTRSQITSANEEELGDESHDDPSDLFKIDDRVEFSDEIQGTVIGFEDGGNLIVVLCDDGKTIKTTAERLKKVQKNKQQEDHSFSSKEKKTNEDHAAAGVKTQTDISEFKLKDRVETKEGKYGSVISIDEITGKIKVLLDNGETLTTTPDQLIIVKHENIQEVESVGDRVKLKADGRIATIQGFSQNKIIVVTDDGETLNLEASDIEIIDDFSGKEKEEIKGQQNNGVSVSIKE